MIINVIGKLLFALIVGYVLNKKGILDALTNRKISYLIMQIAFPCLIISSVSNAQSGDKTEVLKLLIAGFILYALLPFLAILLSRIIMAPKNERSVYQAMFVFSNFLFIGYPVASALYGPECIFYLSIFHMLFNAMYYSYGIFLITKDSKAKGKVKVSSLINNGIIASIIALILFFFNVPMPSFFSDMLKFVGDISTPVSMIIIGATIGTYQLKDVFYNKRLFLVAGIRLIIFPILIYFAMTLAGFDGMLRGVATVTMGMPIASAVSMTSIEYNSHEKLASMSVVVTTLCAIVTIPIMLFILG